MAVEAASRIYNEFSEPPRVKGYSFRDVAIKKALIIPENDYGIEVITSMELLDVATANTPAWATFAISSVARDTNEWTEHTTGHIRVELGDGSDDHIERLRVSTHALQRINARAWYKKFFDIGLGYGPVFQSLADIRIDQVSNLAVATIDLLHKDVKHNESRYTLHPASLDGAIQLGLIASYGGRLSDANTALVPIHFSRLYLDSDIVGATCTAVAHGVRRGMRSAYLDLQILSPDGGILLSMEALRCVGFSPAVKPADRNFTSPYTRLVWKPDIRTLSNRQARHMFPPPQANVERSPQWGVANRLAHLIVLSIYKNFGTLRDGPKPFGEVAHFFDWIKRKGQYDHSYLMEEARGLNDDGLADRIEHLVGQAPDVIEVQIAKLIHDNISDILYERRTGMDIIISENLLTPLYESGLLMTGIYPQLSRILEGISHSNPNLHVLEVGGGTGGATRMAMKVFNGPNGIKAYRHYTFTDISPRFLSLAKESMSGLRDMSFSVYNVEVDPVDQGFQEKAYDLIIACQVLHATSNLQKTLSNCLKLLKPGGRLVLVETIRNFVVPGVVVGTFTGYWAGIPDGRVDAPFQSLDAWDFSLREAGFSGLDLVLDDFPEPHNTTSVILTTATSQAASQPVSFSPVYVLHESAKAPPLIENISAELVTRGFSPKAGVFYDELKNLGPESCVIALFDEMHLSVDSSKQDLDIFQHLARNSARLIAVTSCGIVKGRNAEGALIQGLLRVIQNENPASRYISIDIDADRFEVGNDDAKDVSRCIVDQLAPGQITDSDDGEGDPKDQEFSYQDGCMWVSRHVPDGGFHSQHGLDYRNMEPELLTLSTQGSVRASFQIPGVLNSLCFRPYKNLELLRKDYIDVAVAAMGVSQRDLDHWTGHVDRDHLSSEFAGTVLAVGASVERFKVGDRVYGLGKGHFGNRMRVPATFASKLQPHDDMVRVATMPLAYATAIYALDHIAHVRPGQSVLIQPGASDVGIASICLARIKGADVFAAVQSPEQANFLIDELAMPKTHVIQAPSLTKLRRASKKTHMAGFHIIVNAARGELLSSCSKVLAPLGYFIELGRVDVQAARNVVVTSIPDNAIFVPLDPFGPHDSDPVLFGELMQAVNIYYRRGLIGPIQKITAYDVNDLPSGLSRFSNIGKTVINFQNTDGLILTIPSAPTVEFDSEACYVITGALGGLGRSLIQWMGDRGARHMALLSRRDISSVPEAQQLVQSLSRCGIFVKSYICDVSSNDQVMRVMQQISSGCLIKGVVHAAVAYEDLTFQSLSHGKWNEGLSAKVAGTVNLHQATLDMPLDFFVMITSALSVYAFATQGAYTAANNFQDAFARYRRQMGLAASTISFSLIQNITTVGTDSSTLGFFERNKAISLDESQFLTLLEPVFLNNKTSHKSSPRQWFGQWDDPLSAANLHTYLDPRSLGTRRQDEIASGVSSSSIIPRWYSDGRVSLMMRAFLDVQQQSSPPQASQDTDPKNTVAHLRSEFEKAIQEGSDGRTYAMEIVQGAITNVVAEMLFVDAASIDPAKSVADLGVDSLIAAELRNWFLRGLGSNISMLDLLDPSVSISRRAGSIVDKALNTVS